MTDQLTSMSPIPTGAYFKAALFGALAAFIAVLPVSLVKTFMLLARLCLPLSKGLFDDILSPTTCGIFLNTWDTTASVVYLYVSLTVFAGALAGMAGARIANRPALQDAQAPPTPRPPRVFWPSFGAGLLFDLLFVFVFLYVGQ